MKPKRGVAQKGIVAKHLPRPYLNHRNNIQRNLRAILQLRNLDDRSCRLTLKIRLVYHLKDIPISARHIRQDIHRNLHDLVERASSGDEEGRDVVHALLDSINRLHDTNNLAVAALVPRHLSGDEEEGVCADRLGLKGVR